MTTYDSDNGIARFVAVLPAVGLVAASGNTDNRYFK